MRSRSWSFCVQPNQYAERIETVEKLKAIVRQDAIPKGNHGSFPAYQNGTTGMNWGIYNDSYRVAWALTFSGLFACRAPFNFGNQSVVAFGRPSFDNPSGEMKIPAEQCIDFIPAMRHFFEFFKFATNLAKAEFANEAVTLKATSQGVAGCRIFTTNHEIGFLPTEPARERAYHWQKTVNALELHRDWRDHCSKAIIRFLDLFEFELGQIEESTIRCWLDQIEKNQDLN